MEVDQRHLPEEPVVRCMAALWDLIPMLETSKPGPVWATFTADPGLVQALPEAFRHPGWRELRAALNGTGLRRYIQPLFTSIQQSLIDEFSPPNEALPRIVITTKESEITNEAARVLANDCDSIYDRAGDLSHVVQVDDKAIIAPISVEWMRHLLSQHITWVRTARSPDGDMVYKQAPPAKHVAPTLVNMPDRTMFPHLTGIATSPVIRRDGSVVTLNGYDPESGWMLRLPASLSLVIPESPTPQEVSAAMRLLHDLLRDFPFERRHHRAAALAYLFSLVMRTYYDGPSPFFLFSATTAGSGKGLIIACLSYVAIGQEAQTLVWPKGQRGDEELAKMIHANYVAGYPALSWDNLKSGSAVDSPVFDKALTDRVWTGRNLGESKMVPMLNLAVWSGTGQNITVGADTGRRTIPVCLAPQQERPEERRLRDLEEYVRAQRGPLLSAVLTVIRGWIRVGAPTLGKPMGTYAGWSCVRSVLMWAGEADPLDAQKELRLTDDESFEELTMLHNGWQAAFGYEKMAISAILARVKLNNQNDSDNQVLQLIRQECLGGDGIPSHKLGKLLQTHKGRWLSDRCFHKGESTMGRYWALVKREHPAPESLETPDALDAETPEPGSEG